MEANELIADPLVVKALKVRIETLCIANKQLREHIEALEVVLNSEDEVKLWSSDYRILIGFKENIELKQRIKELENKIENNE